MQSEREQKQAAARDKVLSKACTWLDSRQAKAAANDDDLARARGRRKVAGDELAEAVEKYKKAVER